MTHEHLLSRIVRSARIERGLSVSELAELAGIGEDTVRRIESGVGRPYMRSIRSLATALDTTPAVLLGENAA
jgi:transcriptional regulator with XRE-family HTH domain